MKPGWIFLDIRNESGYLLDNISKWRPSELSSVNKRDISNFVVAQEDRIIKLGDFHLRKSIFVAFLNIIFNIILRKTPCNKYQNVIDNLRKWVFRNEELNLSWVLKSSQKNLMTISRTSNVFFTSSSTVFVVKDGNH